MNETTAARGSTLLDALIGLGMTVFLMAAVGVFVVFHNRKLGAETGIVAAQQAMRAALELIAADVRSAGRREPDRSYATVDPPPGLCVREPSRVRLVADLDGDGDTGDEGEDVSYCRCEGDGARGVYRAYRPADGDAFVVERIADSVSELSFTYGPRAVGAAMSVSITTPLGTFTEAARASAALRNEAAPVTCGPGPACPPEGCA